MAFDLLINLGNPFFFCSGFTFGHDKPPAFSGDFILAKQCLIVNNIKSIYENGGDNTDYKGKNILSYELGTPFTGKEIKDWIWFYVNNSCGQKSIVARAMRHYMNIDDNKYYSIYKQNDRCAAHYGLFMVYSYPITSTRME